MLTDNKTSSYLIYAAQMFFGGWFLLHGLNHFVEIFIQPPGSSSPARVLIGALISSGLFDIIKAVEVISGIMFLSNRFVPLGAILAVPVSLSIAYVNLFLNNDVFGMIVAVIVVGLNLVVMLGYFDYFRPLLTYKTTPLSLDGFKRYLSELF
jgi:hypothetical protein